MALRAPGERRRLRLALQVGLQVFLALTLVAGVNLLAARHPVPGLRGDWTRDSVNTLHPDTAKLLKGVHDPVELVLFYTPYATALPAERAINETVYGKTDLLIREAGSLSPRLRVESIDPATNPDRAQAVLRRTGLEAGRAVGNFLLVHARGRNIQLAFSQLATVEPSTRQLRYQGEDALYRAVAEVTRREARLVTFVQGEGELDPVVEEGLVFTRLLDREAYRLGRTNLARGESIPPGTSVLVLARPRLEYDEATLGAISDYHRHGGNLLILIGAGLPARTLRRYLRTQFKLELGDKDEILYDPEGTTPRFPDWLLMDENFNPEHVISQPLARAPRKVAVLLPRVRPLRLVAPGVCDYLLTSHPGSWPDRRVPGHYARQLDEDEKVPGYEQQGFPLVVAVDPRRPRHRQAGADSGRLVLFCSGDFASSELLATRMANATLLLNAVHWLSGKDAGQRIAPVAIRHPRLALDRRAARLLFWTVVVLPAAVMAVLGFLVFLLRRGG